jgi:hypothetical protein
MLSRLSAPDSATMVGLLTAAGVYLIYTNATPNLTDLRAAPAHDKDAEATRKAAAWKSAALVAVVFLVARDLNSYIISGAALVGIDYMFKHQNGVNPGTGKVDTQSDTVAPSLSQAYPMPDYSEAA